MADGKPLAAGTYVVRLTTDEAKPATGQSAGAERWVEFVQKGQVKGREVVSVIPDSDIAQVAERPEAGQRRLSRRHAQGQRLRAGLDQQAGHQLPDPLPGAPSSDYAGT